MIASAQTKAHVMGLAGSEPPAQLGGLPLGSFCGHQEGKPVLIGLSVTFRACIIETEMKYGSVLDPVGAEEVHLHLCNR